MTTRLIQLLIICVPLALFAWLLRIELVPSGEFVVRHSVGETSPYIDRLLPDGRVKAPMKGAQGTPEQEIFDEPVFFFVHPHRQFDTLEAEIWFKNTGNPIVELGGLARTYPEIYDLKPLQNLLIDGLAWPRISQDGLLLLQREQKYASIDEFLANPPPRHEVATYQFAFETPYRMPGYFADAQAHRIDVSLRGFHEMKTYVKNEVLRFRFRYMDMNRDEGIDPVSVLVFTEQGRPVAEQRAEDDGNASDDALPSVMREIVVEIPDLPEGVYKIELRASRDIFFRRIETDQHKLVFVNSLYLGDEVAYVEPPRPVVFWTESSKLGFSTQHAEGVQTVIVGGQAVEITTPYTYSEIRPSGSGVVKVTVPKSDMIVEAYGHVAFAPDQFFNPDPVRLREDTDLDRLDIKYIIARYTPPVEKDGWYVAKATFDTSVLYATEDGTWKLAFSIPGIRERQTPLVISRIDLTLHRPAFVWADLWDWMKRVLRNS